jgi:opacity protein-like surface antigen
MTQSGSGVRQIRELERKPLYVKQEDAHNFTPKKMKNLRHTLITLLLSSMLLTPKAIAQTGFKPGYMVTHDGDTLRGLIADDESYRLTHKIEFKLDKATKATTYTPTQISTFQLSNGQVFEAKQIEIPTKYQLSGKTVFLELLENGLVKLYYLHSSADQSAMFIQRGNGSLQTLYKVARIKGTNDTERIVIDTILNNATQLPPADYLFTNDYTRTLFTAYADKTGRYTKEPINFDLASIRRNVREYNKTKEPSKGNKPKEAHTPQATIYLGAGYIQALSPDAPYEFVKLTPPITYKYMRGIQFNIGYSNPRISKSLVTDLSVKFISNTSNGSRFVSNYNPKYKMATKGTLAELSFRYHINTTKVVSPYIHLGISGGKIDHHYEEADADKSYTFSFDRDFPDVIFWGGGGVQFHLKQRHLLYLAAVTSFGAEFGALPSLNLGYGHKLPLRRKG